MTGALRIEYCPGGVAGIDLECRLTFNLYPAIEIRKHLEIDAYINPRATTVSSILRHIRHGRVRGVYSVGDAEAEVIEAQILSTSPLAGRQIRDIDFPEGVLVGAVQKGEEFLKPTGSLRIEEGDVIVVFAMADDVPEVEQLFQVTIDFF